MMFTLWRTLFIDPKSGLPWSVIMMRFWLQMTAPTTEAQRIPESSTTTQKTVTKPKRKTTTTAKSVVKPVAKKAVEIETSVPEASAKPMTTTAQPAPKVPSKPAVEPVATAAPKEPRKSAAKTLTSAPKTTAKSTTKATVARNKDSGSLPVRAQNKVTQITTASPKAQIREAVLLLCALQEWTDAATLAEALKHKPDQLETLHLMPMVHGGQLHLLHPENETHPEQAYGLVKSA